MLLYMTGLGWVCFIKTLWKMDIPVFGWYRSRKAGIDSCIRLKVSLIVKVVVSKNLYSCFDRLSDIVLYLT